MVGGRDGVSDMDAPPGARDGMGDEGGGALGGFPAALPVALPWARALLALVLLSALAGGAALVVSFTRGFDLTDEGFMLELFANGRQGNFVSFFHVLVHPLALLVGHRLLVYRLLDGVMFVGAVVVVVHAVLRYGGPFPAWEDAPRRRVLQGLVAAGLTWFAWAGRYWWSYPTLGYSSAPGAMALVSLAGLLGCVHGPSGRVRAAWSAVLAVVALVVFACRPPAGCVLWGVQAAAMVVGGRLLARRQRSDLVAALVAYVAASALVFLPFLVVVEPQLRRILEWVVPAMRASTHQSLFMVEPVDLVRLAACALVSYVVGLLLAEGRGWVVGVATVAGCLTGYRVALVRGPLFLATACAVGVGVLALRGESGGLRASATVVWGGTVLAVTLSCAVGANVEVFTSGTCLTAALGAWCLTLAARMPDGRRSLVAVAALVVVGMLAGVRAIVVGRFRAPYRTPPWTALVAGSRNARVLAGVGLDPADAENIDALIAALRERGFDAGRDRLVAYPDLPGFVAVCGARPLGSSWLFTRYGNVDAANLAWLESEPLEGIRHVYLILGARPSPPLRDFLDGRLRPLPETGTEALGRGAFHERDRFSYRLFLSGPYAVATPEVPPGPSVSQTLEAGLPGPEGDGSGS